jgi:hypothetical protein
MGIMVFGSGMRPGFGSHTFLCTATGGWRLHRPVDRPRDLPCIRIDQDNAYILKMGLRREYSCRPRPFSEARAGRATSLIVVVVEEVVERVVAALLHDAVELVRVDLAVAVAVGLVDHVLELLLGHVLTELLGDAL